MAVYSCVQIGPSGLCALHENKCPLLTAFYSLLTLFSPITFLLEGIIVGFQNICMGSKVTQILIFKFNKIPGTPPTPCTMRFLGRKERYFQKTKERGPPSVPAEIVYSVSISVHKSIYDKVQCPCVSH